jgi:putative selenium metabolism protein SsnA
MIIYNTTIISLGAKPLLIPDGAVYVRNGRIADVGKRSRIMKAYRSPVTINANGKVLMPGLINSHTHLYSTFALGMPGAQPQPRNFMQTLKKVWWRLDKALSGEAIRLSALLSLAQAIRAGTTTLIDHHSSPNAICGSLDCLGDIIEDAGIRACLSYEVSDRDGKRRTREGIVENMRFLQAMSRRSSLVRGLFGLHSSFTLSDETLRRCVTAARAVNAGFHLHCAEGLIDNEDSMKKYGKGVVERLAELGVLGPQTILGHCVHVSEKQITILAKTRTMVVHNPRSNMNNAVGCAPLTRMVKRGVTVGLGTDGMSQSMWDELKTGVLLHKHVARDVRPGTSEMVTALFQNNARIASRIFGAKIGVIGKGAKADLILVDYHPPAPLAKDSLAAHVLFGIANASVDTTIVDGRILMRNRKLRRIDESGAAARGREIAKKVWRRMASS